MNKLFPTIVLWITALTWAGFAIWLSLQPAALLSTFGIQSHTPAMLTEVRAFYGGVELGIAIVMIILWKNANLSAALLIGGLPLGGAAIGRCAGLLIDGYFSTHAIFAAVEALACCLCLAAAFAATRGPQPSAQE